MEVGTDPFPSPVGGPSPEGGARGQDDEDERGGRRPHGARGRRGPPARKRVERGKPGATQRNTGADVAPSACWGPTLLQSRT